MNKATSGKRVFYKMNSSFLPSVAEQLFKDIQKIYQDTSQIPDDMLIALKFIFGPCALQALDLVDQHSVTCLSSPSGRRTFQVTGGSGHVYTCFVSCHFCPCPAFAYTVLRRNEGLLCKHLLAVYLSQAMAVTQQEAVSDQEMTTLLSTTAF
ncbi:zinc finger SWIM domain-containing protein 7 [Boleophthalmus pectinirostris]|uniref:zinc finger SWIM domain-containing protein 7 n=1 Tax=Boleophthalmus pectinirostris TaxID=150288 RepID=UPI00242AD9D1|nr:zinc finger SWIM domain-containing protein 7 [Boleophthalmus pectinirostris]